MVGKAEFSKFSSLHIGHNPAPFTRKAKFLIDENQCVSIRNVEENCNKTYIKVKTFIRSLFHQATHIKGFSSNLYFSKF